MYLDKTIGAVTNAWIKYAARDGGHHDRARLLQNFRDIEAAIGASEYTAHILMAVLIDLADLSDVDWRSLTIDSPLDLSEFGEVEEELSYADGFQNGIDKQLQEKKIETSQD